MERHSYLFKRNLLLTSCLSILTVLFQNHKIVTGQPVLSISGDANCNETATLVCAQPGFSSGTGRLWKKNSIRINENGLVVAGYERYTEESTANDFSLKISGAMPGDIAEYLCEYNFQTSNTEQLSFECKPTTSGVKCRRNNDDKLECDISDVYPNTTTVDSVILTPQGEGAAETISGTLGPPVDSSGDYFNFIWTSTDVIPDGSYGCQFTITTISATNITISFTFEITTPTPEPTTALPSSSTTTVHPSSSTTTASPSSPTKEQIIIIICVAVAVLVIGISVFVCVKRKRKANNGVKQNAACLKDYSNNINELNETAKDFNEPAKGFNEPANDFNETANNFKL